MGIPYRDNRTLLDKMIEMLMSLDIRIPYYFVADAYYATGKNRLAIYRKSFNQQGKRECSGIYAVRR